MFVALALGATTLSATETPDARVLAAEGFEAQRSGDHATFLAKLEVAAQLRPDYPRLLTGLAAAQTANDQLDAAIGTLEQLAALGVYSAVEQSDDFAALREHPKFKDLVARFDVNLRRVGRGEIAFALREVSGLIEGIAFHEATGDYFFGDVHERAVWRRSKDGTVQRFTAPAEELLGVFGLAIDEARGALWAAMSALPEMSGFDKSLKGAAGFAEIDLATGAVRRVVRLPSDGQEHLLGDLALAGDGTVFATDSATPRIWRFAPNHKTAEIFTESPLFVSLQGLAFTRDGGALHVADHVNGILRVDLTSRAVVRVEAPSSTTLIGIDGLARAENGDLIAVQNGLRPLRVLRLALEPGGEAIGNVAILEAAHPIMPDPTLGCIVGDKFIFVGDAGWARFADGEKPATPRSVAILQTSVAP